MAGPWGRHHPPIESDAHGPGRIALKAQQRRPPEQEHRLAPEGQRRAPHPHVVLSNSTTYSTRDTVPTTGQQHHLAQPASGGHKGPQPPNQGVPAEIALCTQACNSRPLTDCGWRKERRHYSYVPDRLASG